MAKPLTMINDSFSLGFNYPTFVTIYFLSLVLSLLIWEKLGYIKSQFIIGLLTVIPMMISIFVIGIPIFESKIGSQLGGFFGFIAMILVHLLCVFIVYALMHPLQAVSYVTDSVKNVLFRKKRIAELEKLKKEMAELTGEAYYDESTIDYTKFNKRISDRNKKL